MYASKPSRSRTVDYGSISGDATSEAFWKPLGPTLATASPKPDWNFGHGANDNGHSLTKSHIEIDPFEDGRPMLHNYCLLISGIVPRPIGLVSTVSKAGQQNLAPFSYFQVVDHDPPVFVIGFSGRSERPKDTLRNLEETGECCINIVSEHIIEAVNAASIDAPFEISEWALSGLSGLPCKIVDALRVHESPFSIEGRLLETVGFKTSHAPVGEHGRLAIIEGLRFWAREDAIDPEKKHLSVDVLRPVGQLGGASYSRTTETLAIARRNWVSTLKESGELIKKCLGIR